MSKDKLKGALRDAKEALADAHEDLCSVGEESEIHWAGTHGSIDRCICSVASAYRHVKDALKQDKPKVEDFIDLSELFPPASEDKPAFGLYHSPAVNTATLTAMWENARRCPDFEWHHSNRAACVCGDPSHYFMAKADGWNRIEVGS